jgi:hypothetical protein
MLLLGENVFLASSYPAAYKFKVGIVPTIDEKETSKIPAIKANINMFFIRMVWIIIKY